MKIEKKYLRKPDPDLKLTLNDKIEFLINILKFALKFVFLFL
jgi:hypothetical protein